MKQHEGQDAINLRAGGVVKIGVYRGWDIGYVIDQVRADDRAEQFNLYRYRRAWREPEFRDVGYHTGITSCDTVSEVTEEAKRSVDYYILLKEWEFLKGGKLTGHEAQQVWIEMLEAMA